MPLSQMQIIREEELVESFEENIWGDGIPIYENKILIQRANSEENFNFILNNEYDFGTGKLIE
jgi:hypothetical protein